MNDLGLKILKSFERLRLHAYSDATGTLTIGWGDTWHATSPDQVIDEPQANAWLAEVLEALESHLNELVRVTLSPNQKSALLDFLYNEGYGNLQKSTLLKKINHGDMSVEAEFKAYCYSKGKFLPGLLTRRRAEWALFRGDEKSVAEILAAR